MDIYTSKDLELAQEKLGPIVDKIQKEKLQIFEPTIDEIMKVNKIIMNFIKENKRKIYGGYAQNELVKAKNKKDAFYEDDAAPDVDFYSPDPIGDMKKLCNILHNEGFKYVQGKEAGHKETYKVFVNFEDSADISYVPKNIYHRMPFVTIDGINYVHPSFIMLDMYRMLTEPYFSSFRWEKTFPRIYLLQKYYPFNKATAPLPKIYPKNNDNKNILLNTIFNYLIKSKTSIVVGEYAYNIFLEKSGIMNDKKKSKIYRYLDIPFYRFVSINYRDDVKELLNLLKSENKSLSSNITIVEHYPFWQLLGYSTYIYYKDEIIAHVIHYNKKCTPTKEVDARLYVNGKIGKMKGKITIGCYNYCLLNNMIIAFRQRTLRDNKKYQYYNIMTSHLYDMRNYFLKKNNKTIFDDTIFQEFISECKGATMDPMRESRLHQKKRWLQKKFPITYSYSPEAEYSEDTETNYRFPNSSGNPINRERNFKIEGEDIPRQNFERKEKKKNDAESDDDDDLELEDLEKSIAKKN